MKKILLVFTFLLFFTASKAQAETLKVISLEKFSTANPASTYSVQTIEKKEFKNGMVLEAETIIAGKVERIQPPRRGKRNAYFVFIPTSTTYNGITKTSEKPIIMAQVVGYKPINPTGMVYSVAKKAVGFAVKGASLGISFVEGVAQAEDGTRIKSGFIKTYKDSPLAYVEIGTELNIEVGDTLILKLKKIKE